MSDRTSLSSQQSLRRSAAAAALGLAGLVGVLGAMPAVAQDAQPVIREGMSEPVKAWRQAVETGNTEAMRRMHTDATDLFAPDAMIVKGREKIASSYGEMFKKFKARVGINDARYIQTGNLVHSWGLYTLTLEPVAGGEPIVIKGRFSDIATSVNGQWQYVMDHASLPSGK